MQQTTGSFADADEMLKSFSLSDIRMVRTLEHVTSLLDFLGSPQNKMQVIHVAGMRHKVPTTVRIAEHLHTAGAKVGVASKRRLYTGLNAVDPSDYYQALEEFLTHVRHSGLKLTRDELLAAFQYWYFGRKQVDFVIVGAGSGGLLDPTNTVTRTDKVCVLPDMDSNMAEHITGIVQPQNTIFCSRQAPPLMDTITNVARQKQADLHVFDNHEALARAAAHWALGQER